MRSAFVRASSSSISPNFVMAKRSSATSGVEHLKSLVLKEVKGDYAILTMNRPKVNAIDHDMLKALRLRYKELVEVDKVRGLILTGKPGVYSAGLDLPYLSTLSVRQMEEWFDYFSETMAEMVTTELITIAAISGHSPAGGAVFALTTDYRVMAQGNYQIGLNEVAVGLAMPSGVAALAVSQLGQRNAERAIFTGKLWNVDEALKLGFIDEAVALDQVVPRSEQIMKEWLAGSKPLAVKRTKKSMRADVLKAFDDQRANGKKWVEGFFGPETQAVIAEFKANLAKKSQTSKL